jgi:saccharopine dehydrogenase-like NADP-dependent oxidoreductase
MGRVLVIGGYGAFGARVSERLAREPKLNIIIAGRREDAARDAAHELSRTAQARVNHAAIDAASATSEALRSYGATVVINASGPFQDQTYNLARACIAARCHYIDLADARAFVTGITELDDDARAAGVCVVSGASSVPGLSSAVVTAFAADIQDLEAIDIGISPGNSFDPGLATTASILGAAGEPHSVLENGRRRTAYGWQSLRRHRFPGLGARLMSSVDVPDLELMPQHFPSLQSVRFCAGIEVSAFHLALWGLAGLRRAGLMRDPGRLAGALLGAKRKFRFLGSDEGGMFVKLSGRDAKGEPRSIEWTLIAHSGDGPYVPAMAAVILAKRLAEGNGPAPGAQPCFALFTLADFEAEVYDLDITFDTQSS